MILAFPSREFADEEFPTNEEIQAFGQSQQFPGIFLALGHVTGPRASNLWKFFLSATGAPEPTWNFASKFVVSKTGVVLVAHSHNLEATIASLMKE